MDPLTISALIGAGANIFGSVFGSSSSAKRAEQTNAAQIALAEKQMQFQREMRRTAHQDEVSDLLAAGLNPILSANSGAPMAMGAQASLINPGDSYAAAGANAGRSISDAVNSMVTNSKALAERKKVQAETSVLGSTARQAAAEASLADIKLKLQKKEYEFLDSHPEVFGLGVLGKNVSPQAVLYAGTSGALSSAKQVLGDYDSWKASQEKKAIPVIMKYLNMFMN